MAAEQGTMRELGTATLKVDRAKVIKMARGQQPLNILRNYVIDKGEWKPIRRDEPGAITNCATQIKAGLFVVDMPPPAGERQRDVAPTLSRPLIKPNYSNTSTIDNSSNRTSTRKIDNDLGLEIYSVDTSDCLTATNSSSRGTEDDQENDTVLDQWRANAIGSPSTLDSYPTKTSLTNHASSSPTLPSPSPSPSSSPSPPFITTKCIRNTRRKAGRTPHLQIGNGQHSYTFVFRIVEATAVTSLLLASQDLQLGGNTSTTTTQYWLQYNFFDYQVRHDVISKGNSWHVTDAPMHLSLRGHLHDLQQWLYQQGQIEVCLVVVDKAAKCDHTIGKAMVRLKGWCPSTIEQASFPIHDRSNRLHVDQPFQFAKVVVQLGLLSGWHDYDDGGVVKSNLIDNNHSHVQQQHRYPNLIN